MSETSAASVRVLYTAEATATGGRAGHAASSDGRLDVDLSVPNEIGGDGGPGTNPEQLFAAGYAACFGGALDYVAKQKKRDATQARISCAVSIGPRDGGGFGIAVQMKVEERGIERAVLEGLVREAHEKICPYSHATRNNVSVTFEVLGK